MFHSAQAGGLAARSVNILFKDASLPRGLGSGTCLAHSYKGASPLVESPRRGHTPFGTPSHSYSMAYRGFITKTSVRFGLVGQTHDEEIGSVTTLASTAAGRGDRHTRWYGHTTMPRSRVSLRASGKRKGRLNRSWMFAPADTVRATLH